MIIIPLFRLFALILTAYFWWLGIGNNLYIGSSFDNSTSWGGGLRYLTNWVLTLNLLVAINAILFEIHRNYKFFTYIYSSTLSMNIVIIVLYWGMRFIDQSLLDVNSSEWTLFQWVWDFYLHWGMTIIVAIEIIFLSKLKNQFIKEYTTLMIVFFGYILWIEYFISSNNKSPCGLISCGFPYPFLNDLISKERIVFYFGVWIIGSVSFLSIKIIINLNNKLKINKRKFSRKKSTLIN